MSELTRFSLACGSLLVVQVVLLPVQIYRSNRGHFNDGLESILPELMLLALVAWLFLTLAGLALPRRWRALGALVVMAATCTLVVNAEILALTEDYLFDGSPLTVTYGWGRAALYFAAMAGPLVAILLFRAGVESSFLGLTAAILLWTGLSALAPTAGATPSQSMPPTIDGVHELSIEHNIIHVMFDSLQAELVAELVASGEGPDFDGFEFYDNHAGVSNWTSISMVSMLTGRNLFDQPLAGDPWRTASRLLPRNFVRELEDGGYETAFLGPGGRLCEVAQLPCARTDSQLAPRRRFAFGPARAHLVFIDAHVELLDAAVLRAAPVFVKQAAYAKGWLSLGRYLSPWLATDEEGLAETADALDAFPENWALVQSVYRSKTAFDNLIRDLIVRDRPQRGSVGDRGKYLFVHVFPPHRPFLFAKNCEVRPITANEVNERMGDIDGERYRASAHCALLLFDRLLRRLKALGVYEQSTIILQSDTGLGIDLLADGASNSSAALSTVLNLSRHQIMAYARPVLAIKRKGASGPMVSVGHPSSQHHTYNSILALAGLPRNSELPPPFWEARPKPRRFFLTEHTIQPGAAYRGYEELLIGGHRDDPAGWRRVGLYEELGRALESPSPVEAISVDIDRQTANDGSVQLLLSARVDSGSAAATQTAEFMFVARPPTATGQARMVEPYGPRGTAMFTAGQVGCGLEVYVYARALGSLERYQAKQVVRLGAESDDC